jgi:hypothetical protein
MKRIRILGSGLSDIEVAKHFYDSGENGVGDYFLETVFSEIESLKLYGGIHPVRWGFHRQIVRKFPFAVYYKMEGDVVIVFRVLDCRRDPNRLKGELKIKSEQGDGSDVDR